MTRRYPNSSARRMAVAMSSARWQCWSHASLPSRTSPRASLTRSRSNGVPSASAWPRLAWEFRPPRKGSRRTFAVPIPVGGGVDFSPSPRLGCWPRGGFRARRAVGRVVPGADEGVADDLRGAHRRRGGGGLLPVGALRVLAEGGVGGQVLGHEHLVADPAPGLDEGGASADGIAGSGFDQRR